MRSTKWRLPFATALVLTGAPACGGAVSSSLFDAGKGTDGEAPPVVYLGFDDASADSDAEAPAFPLPCDERPVPAHCSKSNPPYYSAASLDSAWAACGGTSGAQAQCGVLDVSFDENGCASVEFYGEPSGSGVVACVTKMLDTYRFECSAGSGIALNHLCN